MPRVSRGLDANVVRRVVQRNINQVRHCYGQALAQTPDLHGRVSIELTISPAGSVPLSAVAQSSLRNPEAERCIAGAVRRWAFPQPDPAGIVRATLPFKLTTETPRH
jgi:TonB family protein